MIFAFEEFHLDTDRAVLLRDGVEQKIEPKAFALLQFLVESGDRLLSKDEIIDQIWGGRVVSEAAISSAIKAVRQVLDDDGVTQRFVRTVHGRGYRFAADVERQHQNALANTQVADGDTPSEAVRIERPTVAVLAFENMSNDDQQFFADGMTEDITTALSRCRDLTVVSRTSSFAYRGKSIDARQIGRELGARYLLEGSIRRNGDRARITAQLIDARTGHHVWAEKYDRSVTDVFAVQDEITANVAGATGSEITAAEAQQASRRDRQSLAAWEMLMKAEWHMSKGERAHLTLAKQLCKQAIDASGNASKAYSMLSMAHCTELLYSWGNESADDLIDQAVDAGKTATGLDPQNEHGFLALGLSHWSAGNHQAAISHCQTAIDLNPTHCLANLVLGFVWGYCGQEYYEKAQRLIGYSMSLGPRDLHGYWAHTHLATFDIVSGKYDAAAAKAATSIARNPNLGRAHRIKAAALALGGDQSAAGEAWNHSTRIDPIETERYFQILARTFNIADEADKVITGMKRAAGLTTA